MKKVMIILLLFLCSCTYTGNAVAGLPADFLRAEMEVMTLNGIAVPEHELVDSFFEEFGSTLYLKVYKTRWWFVEDASTGYIITTDGVVGIERMHPDNFPEGSWHTKVDIDDVGSLVSDIKVLLEEGADISAIIGLTRDVSTSPRFKRGEMLIWLHDAWDEYQVEEAEDAEEPGEE